MSIFKRKQQSPELLELLATTDEVAARRIRSDSDRTDEQDQAADFFEGRARDRRKAARRKREAGQ